MPGGKGVEGLVEQPRRRWQDIDARYLDRNYGYSRIVPEDGSVQGDNYADPTVFVDKTSFYPRHVTGFSHSSYRCFS